MTEDERSLMHHAIYMAATPYFERWLDPCPAMKVANDLGYSVFAIYRELIAEAGEGATECHSTTEPTAYQPNESRR